MQDILIVEDGRNERERLQRIFASDGYRVSAAESAQEAETLLARETFRLAILDIGLADKSGSYLFDVMRRAGKIPFVIILTGNPSIHLKQRFLDEGAVAYIVKASSAAGNESLLDHVRGLLGPSNARGPSGIPLADFLALYAEDGTRELFFDDERQLPKCSECGASEFLVTFEHKTQIPPLIEGRVICAQCQREFDPKVG